jgi:hypothetical protein
MKKFGLALLAGAALVAGSGWAIAQHGQVPPPKVSLSVHPQAIPFTLFRGNRVVASARLNGHATDVILDTGASVTTVDRAYARSIGLPEGMKIQGRGAGGTVEAELVSGVTLEIGGTRFDDMSVAVMDLSPVARGIGHPMNIILGREFFNSSVISIDWAASQLRVTPHDRFAARKDATALQLKRRGPFNTIPVEIAGGEPVEALLDLGNGSALVVPKSYWGGRADLSALPYAEGRSGGVGGLHASRNTTVPQVTLAGRTFARVPAAFVEGGNDHEPAQMTNVGIGLLKQFHVDLDLGRDRIYLAPRSDAPAFDRDRAGARVDLLGDRLKVSFVSPGSPAATAGLKAGDEITSVDGHPVTPGFYGARDWSKGPAGTPVVLKRADGTSVTVTLRDYF